MALPKLLQKLFQNGGAGGRLNRSIMPAEMVGVDAQSFTDAQKQQGRANLGAGSQSDVDALATGLATLEVNTNAHIRVVETWSSGSNWYRKWSDGWIEQGGYLNYVVSTMYTEYYVISLNTPFNSVDYTVTATPDSLAIVLGFYSNSRTTTQFRVWIGAKDSGVTETVNGALWYACGY